MCLIIEKKKGQSVSHKMIASAWASNPHGAGIVIPDKKPCVIKGIMSLDDLKTALRSVDRYYAVVHLRFATHGAISGDNTHPHKIDDGRYLIHNGVLSSFGIAGTGADSISDSADLARSLSPLDSNVIMKLLDSLPGKYTMIDRNVVSYHGYFQEHKGFKVSNTNFVPDTRWANYRPISPLVADYLDRRSRGEDCYMDQTSLTEES